MYTYMCVHMGVKEMDYDQITGRQKREAVLNVCCALFLLAKAACFAFVWLRYYKPRMEDIFYIKGDMVVILLYVLVDYIFTRIYGGFNAQYQTNVELIYSNIVASVLGNGIMYLVMVLLIRKLTTILPMLGLVVCSAVLSALWSTLVKKVTRRMFHPRRTLLIYGNPEAKTDGEEILGRMPETFRQVASASAEVGSDELRKMIREEKARAVMLCGVSSSVRNDVVKFCVDQNVEAFVRPNIGDYLLQGAESLQLQHIPVLLCHRASPSIWYLLVKRLADIVLSLSALILLSPLMLVTAIAIKAYDGGPVLYKQCRLTKDRKEFYVYKFRSMRVDAEKDGVARLAQENDDRITPVGKIIRACRVDELPQLFDILAGSMSIVGPRPERPEIAAQYEEEMPEFGLRLQAKAGLTGLAQVGGKDNTTRYNKLLMDLQYISEMSLAMDMKIIFATIKILFMPESTEGVADGATTAMGQEKQKQ